MLDWEFVAQNIGAVILAVPTTLQIVVCAVPAGWVLGMLIALVRGARVPVVGQLLAVYVSFMRSVPTVVILFVAYYALPMILAGYFGSIGLSVDLSGVPPIVYSVVAFALDQAAYSSEVFRSAIGAVDKGQLEAAQSVGMTTAQAYLRIVLPQALVTSLPNLNGLFVGLVQGSSLAYYVGVYEITATSTLVAAVSYSYMEAYLMATVVYEVLSFVINRAFRALESRVSGFRTQGGVPVTPSAQLETAEQAA